MLLGYQPANNTNSIIEGHQQPIYPKPPSTPQRLCSLTWIKGAYMERAQKGEGGRVKFIYEGRTVYEWEQSLQEINIYIQVPEGVTSKMIDCRISSHELNLGLKGNPPFLKEQTGGAVNVGESFWLMDGGELTINLQKLVRGETWSSALQGRGAEVDPATKEEMKKKIMLERFQDEHPGFDFSNAEFNGAVPDANSFMGGVR
ncbi:unnamed protein product [Chrysoparadoxa australica]